ncbi:hypothetical protein [Maricaulis sp.]|uniref:hypothetical protein n=1 Tax=Maricaulis sp. TaxID=1486257 RepID=UPI0026113522|nr:hypothetical protein [Maricaulis sp.]
MDFATLEMDFSTLQDVVTGQYDAASKTFNFDAAAYSSAAISDLKSTKLGQVKWALTGAPAPEVDKTAKTVTVTGQAKSLIGLANVSVSMVFFISGEEAQLLVAVTLPKSWSFTKTYPELKGTVFDKVDYAGTAAAPILGFASASYTDASRAGFEFAKGANFYGDVIMGGDPLSTLKMIFGAFTKTHLSGAIEDTAHGPNMSLTVELGVTASLADKFPILTKHLSLALVSNFDAKGAVLSGLEISTSFDFGGHKGLKVGTYINPWGTPVLPISGSFTGISLPSISSLGPELTSLIGADDLASALPEGYGDRSHLELLNVGFTLDLKSFKPVSVNLMIGTPEGDPGWSLDSVAKLEQLRFAVNVDNPFGGDGKRSLKLSVHGEADVNIGKQTVDMVADASATFVSGGDNAYSVSAALAPGTDLTVSMSDLLGAYVPAAKNVPDINFDSLGFNFDFKKPKNHYAFYASLDSQRPAEFKFGGTTALVIKSGTFNVANDSNKGNPGGSVTGAIEIFTIETDFNYTIPGEFAVTAHFPEFHINLAKVVADLADASWGAPDWFPEITFPKTDLYLAHSTASNTDTVALRAAPDIGVIVLQVLKAGGKWGFAAAVDLDVEKIAAFAGLDVLSEMDDYFKVDDLLFAFASADMPGGFQFPPPTAFPAAKSKAVALPSWSGPLKQGFYFFGGMTFNTAKQKNLTLVEDMFSLPSSMHFDLFVMIGLNPSKEAKAQASVRAANVKIGDIEFAELEGTLGLQMQAGVPSFFVEGALTTTIHDNNGAQTISSQPTKSRDRDLTAALSFELSDNAAYLAASMIGQVSFDAITLADLVMVIGIDFEGIPSLGMACQIDLSSYDTTYDSSIAFFFDSGNPQNSLFAGAVSDIHLGQVLQTIVGEITSGADEPPDWMVSLFNEVALEGTQHFTLPGSAQDALDKRDYTALSSAFNSAMSEQGIDETVSFAEATTMIVVGGQEGVPNGQWFITNYPASGVIQHYELEAGGGQVKVAREAQLYYCMPPTGGSITLGPPSYGITFNSGIYVDGVLKVFWLELETMIDVRPNQGLAADVELKKPINVISIPGTDMVVLGIRNPDNPKIGPQLNLSTFPQGEVGPHLFMEGELSFLGITQHTDIKISDKGFHVDFGTDVGTKGLGASYDVKADLDSLTDFEFSIDAEFHINHPDFKFFNVDLGTIDLDIKFAAGLKFGYKNDVLFFEADGFHFDLFGHRFGLPKIKLAADTDNLKDIPGIIFDAVRQAIWDFVSDPARWLEWVGKGIIQGVKDVEKVLEDVFHALSSVWSSDKRILVAVHHSYAASEAFTVTITPSTPTAGVTQAMIDSATAWGNEMLQDLVAQEARLKIRGIPPADVASFNVSTLNDVDASYELNENQIWFVRPQAAVPSLVELGFEHPLQDKRFFSQTTAAAKFSVAVAIAGDFNTDLSRVTVSVRYNGKTIGMPYIFTSNIAHNFHAPWDVAEGEKYELQYEAEYLDASKPKVTSPWMRQRGAALDLIVQSA